jgi:hypothetical protein
LVPGVAAAQSSAPATAPAAAPAPLGRWLEVQTGTVAVRYRYLETSAGVVTANQGQYAVQLKARFKFDPKGRVSVAALLATGNSFTGGWNSSGAGTGEFARDFPFKQLVLAVAPAKGVDLSAGSMGFTRGESTEITTYDNDGYLTGERVSVKRPNALYFDELSVTSAFLGDTSRPSIWDRGNFARAPNYFQYFASKKVGAAVAASADYTRVSGVGTFRVAAALKTPRASFVDTIRYEQYFRDGVKSGRGFAVTADRALTKRWSVGLGFAAIDADDGALNADRFGKGRRVFETATFKVTREFAFQMFAGQSVNNPFAVSNRFRYDLIASYNLLARLQRAGYLK